MSIKHNKIKNTGILFELLVRKIATDVLEGRSDSFATKIVSEHFNSKTELGKELKLYRSFFSKNELSENKAFNLLDIVLSRRKKLNERVLQSQKYQLIKEIKENCDDLKQFLSGRVPSYKVYASVYKLFESSIREDDMEFMETDELVSSRFVVVEHLKGELAEEAILKENEYMESVKNQPEEIRVLSYKMLLEKFNEKYSVFNSKQKSLLKEFINVGTDVVKFTSFISEEATVLISEITEHKKYINDEVTRIKLHEVVAQLQDIKNKRNVKTNHITALLIGYQILEELESLRG